MKRVLLALAVSFSAGLPLVGQQIEVVFEHRFNAEGGPLPILKARGAALAQDTADGTNPMDSYGGFQRYDADRLLLGVRENGINEQDPTHDRGLAAAYPDRSLIWINATNGAPLGVALVVGHRPVPLDADFLAAGGSAEDFYFNFAVAEDGVLFVGYKNKILRYAPKPGNPPTFEGPTVAYTQANDGSDRWYQWRWEQLRASGKGADTVLWAGGKTWRASQGYRSFRTADGLTFESTGYAAAAGGASRALVGMNPSDVEDEWVYGTAYPGSSNGVDSRISRWRRNTVVGGDFSAGPAYTAQTDEAAGYLGQFVTDVDGQTNLSFVVSYSTPSYNSRSSEVNAVPPRPGWLALHDHQGHLLGARKLEVTEDLELVDDPSTEADAGQWHATLGMVTVKVLPGMAPNTAEVLWYSGVYGYGRYLVSYRPLVTPMFEHLFNAASVPLPILKAQSTTADKDTYDGTSQLDSYGGFRRYDANRLLLGIRENGINEQDPQHDRNLAAAYPDRSLIWINPVTGAPMGLALNVGLRPVPLDADFAAAGGTPDDYYFNFAVADDGVVYVGYKNKILRYAPTPGGTEAFGPPTVAYTQANDASDFWHEWRWEELRAQGAGAETVLVAGGKTYRPSQGYRVFTTTDGLAFEPNGYWGAGGGASRNLPGANPGDADEEWLYVTQYPGSSSGRDSRIDRAHRSRQNLGDFQAGPVFTAQIDEAAGYFGEFVTSVDAHPAVPFVVSYSTPSWNSLDPNVNVQPPRPGALAIHDAWGRLLQTHPLPVTETLELVEDPAAPFPAATWHATLGGVSVYPIAGAPMGAYEVLWYSGIYGYGRYWVGPEPEPTEAPSISITLEGTDVVVRFTGILQVADQVEGPYVDVTGATGSVRVPVSSAPKKFWRARGGAVPVTPTITISREGNEVVIQFTGVLQRATRVEGPYADVSGAANEVRVPVSEALLQFWRARGN